MCIRDRLEVEQLQKILAFEIHSLSLLSVVVVGVAVHAAILHKGYQQHKDQHDPVSYTHLTVQVALNSGSASAKAWGCDLTYDYVKINGDYRT